MAASLCRCLRYVAQKQFSSTIRFWKKTELRTIKAAFPRPFLLFRLISTGSVGAGASFGFLGFGKKKEEDDGTDILTKTYREARIAHHKEEFEKADQLYHATLKLAEELLKKEEITKEKSMTARTMVYDGLADIALKTGQIELARTLLIETMKGCLQQGMETDHNAIIEMSLKLSGIYAMMRKAEEAEEGFKFCVQSQSAKMKEREKEWLSRDSKGDKVVDQKPDELEEKEQDTAVLLGMALGSYGRFLLHEKRFKEALPFLERARLYAQHTLGTNSNQYIVMLNDIATLHIVSRNYEKAEEILNTGITIADKGKLEEEPMLYCNLGAVHLRRGQGYDATKACEKAKSLAKQFNHQMASKMADTCLKKCESLTTK